jgi:hypothetical protein
MAPRATGFAKKPPAAAVEAPRVEIRAPVPEEYVEPPDPISLNLGPLVAPYRKRGRVTVRVERLPHRARLSHGQNNGDRSWSLALDELEGVAYLPANSADEIQTLSIRIIRVDGGDAATLAVLDYPMPSTAHPHAKADTRATAADDGELRTLREELAKASATLEARTFELAEMRRTASAAPKLAIEAELAAMRTSWEAEVEERLALAARAAQEDLEKARAAWRVEEDTRVAKAEKRVRESSQLGIGDVLAKAEKEWKAAEATRHAAAQAKWQQQSAAALAEAKAELEKLKTKAPAAPAKPDDSELRRLREELAKAMSSLAESGREVAEIRSQAEALRSDKAKLARLNDELARSKTRLEDRESESAKARTDAETLRTELENTRTALAARDDELKRSRFSAEQARTEAEALRGDTAQLKRLNAELASAKASLAVRDAELARTRASQEDARSRARQDAETSVSEALNKWKAGEAERLVAEEARWREHSDMAIAEVVARLDEAEARARAEVENNRNSDGEIRRLADDLARTRAALAERENELVQARLGQEQARARWMQETETTLAKAQQAWKAGEAERSAESESETAERSKLALASMTAQVKQLEAALTEARGQVETLRHRGDSADFRQLRKEFASLQSTLAQRENELMQLRTDHELDRERWTSEARVAVKRAEYQWQNADAEETERNHRAQTARRLLRDAFLAACFVGLAMLGYYTLAPMLSDSAPEIFQPILNQAGISTDRPSSPRTVAGVAGMAAKPSLSVVRGVNLRVGPSTTAAVIASLPRDTKVTSLDSQGNWVHVQFTNSGGKLLEGWAFKSFLQADTKTAPPSK